MNSRNLLVFASLVTGWRHTWIPVDTEDLWSGFHISIAIPLVSVTEVFSKAKNIFTLNFGFKSSKWHQNIFCSYCLISLCIYPCYISLIVIWFPFLKNCKWLSNVINQWTYNSSFRPWVCLYWFNIIGINKNVLFYTSDTGNFYFLLFFLNVLVKVIPTWLIFSND